MMEIAIVVTKTGKLVVLVPADKLIVNNYVLKRIYRYIAYIFAVYVTVYFQMFFDDYWHRIILNLINQLSNILIIEYFLLKKYNKDIYLFAWINFTWICFSNSLIPIAYFEHLYDSVFRSDLFWSIKHFFGFYRYYLLQITILFLAHTYLRGKKFKLSTCLYLALFELLITYGFLIHFLDKKLYARNIITIINCLYGIGLYFTANKVLAIKKYKLVLYLVILLCATNLAETIMTFYAKRNGVSFFVPITAMFIVLVITLKDAHLKKIFNRLKYIVLILVVATGLFYFEYNKYPDKILIQVPYLVILMAIGRNIYQEKHQFIGKIS